MVRRNVLSNRPRMTERPRILPKESAGHRVELRRSVSVNLLLPSAEEPLHDTAHGSAQYEDVPVADGERPADKKPAEEEGGQRAGQGMLSEVAAEPAGGVRTRDVRRRDDESERAGHEARADHGRRALRHLDRREGCAETVRVARTICAHLARSTCTPTCSTTTWTPSRSASRRPRRSRAWAKRGQSSWRRNDERPASPMFSREGGPSCGEPTTGLEPVTPVLQVRCATNCAKSAGAVLQCRRRPGCALTSRGQDAGAVVAGAGDPEGDGDGERVGVGVP